MNAECILIATYSLFNGRSKFFASRGSNTEPIELVGVLCDDGQVTLTDVRNSFAFSATQKKRGGVYNDLGMRFRIEFDQIGRIGSFEDVVER